MYTPHPATSNAHNTCASLILPPVYFIGVPLVSNPRYTVGAPLAGRLAFVVLPLLLRLDSVYFHLAFLYRVCVGFSNLCHAPNFDPNSDNDDCYGIHSYEVRPPSARYVTATSSSLSLPLPMSFDVFIDPMIEDLLITPPLHLLGLLPGIHTHPTVFFGAHPITVAVCRTEFI